MTGRIARRTSRANSSHSSDLRSSLTNSECRLQGFISGGMPRQTFGPSNPRSSFIAFFLSQRAFALDALGFSAASTPASLF